METNLHEIAHSWQAAKHTPSKPRKPQSHPVLDHVMGLCGIKNDADLARFLGCKAPDISKIRCGKHSVSASMAIAMHERAALPFSEIRRLLGVDSSYKF